MSRLKNLLTAKKLNKEWSVHTESAMDTPTGGRGWIRTTEAKKRQIYSLFPLATRELSHIMELVDGLEPPTC